LSFEHKKPGSVPGFLNLPIEKRPLLGDGCLRLVGVGLLNRGSAHCGRRSRNCIGLHGIGGKNRFVCHQSMPSNIPKKIFRQATYVGTISSNGRVRTIYSGCNRGIFLYIQMVRSFSLFLFAPLEGPSSKRADVE
jgi:hypothetical protein